MARIERIESTQPVPVEQAQLVSPGDFPFSTASAEAFEVIGGVLGELGKRRREARDSLSVSEMRRSQELSDAKMKQFMIDNPDTEKWLTERQRLNQEHGKFMTGLKVSSEVREKMDIAFQAFDEKSVIDTNILATAKDIDNDIKATGAGLITAISNNDGSAEGQLREDEVRDAHEAALLRKDTPEVAAIQLLETLREGEKQRVSVLVTEGRYEEARELVHKSKAFEAEDAVQTLKRIEISELHNKRKTIDLDHDADMKVNEDFVSLIIGKDLVPDTVQNSRLDDKAPRGIFQIDKLSKQEWMQYVSSSTEDPPTKTTPKGLGTISSTVFDYAKFKIPKEAAYRRLLDSRYIHEEITEEDFEWAVNHINKPYPSHIATDIEVVNQSTAESIAKGGFLWGLITTDAEEEKAKSVNLGLISWVDSEIAQGREPTREQMYNKSAQLRAQSGKEETQSIASPKTKADYDKLPPDTVYLDPDSGRLYRKK